MSKIDLVTAENVAKQLHSLMQQADLTVYGLAEGARLSTHTVNRILKKKTNLSSGSAKKLALFFSIPLEKIFSDSLVKLKKIENIPSIYEFHKTNSENDIYFISKFKENKVATFIKETLVYDSFINEGKRSKEISEYILKVYGKDFDPKVVAKALERLYNENVLNRDDKTGAASVYYYSLVNKVP